MRLTCPACKGELAPQKCDFSTLEIDCCFTCRGLWFDRDELRRLFTSPKLYKKFRLPEYNFRVKLKEAPPTRECPRCPQTALREMTLGDIVVDECAECLGIWLDSGEISRLMDLLESGKLKGKSETAKQLRKGRYDKSPLGQASHFVGLAFKMLF